MIKTFNLGALVLDPKLQSRVEIDETAVSEYAEAIGAGDKFPPVLVFFDGVHFYLTDGYHRYHAHTRAGRVSIEAEVVNGTFRDAVFHATSVNSKHGMRRSNADKRKAVMTLLEDFEWEGMTSSEIARHCGVSVAFVSNLRNVTGKQTEGTIKYRDKDGEIKEKKKAPGRPVKEKEPELKEPANQEQPETKVEEFDPRDELIEQLTKENDQLTMNLALAHMGGTEEQQNEAREIMNTLREEIRVLNIELVAVKQSRDTFQSENAQLKKQVSMLQRKLKQFEPT